MNEYRLIDSGGERKLEAFGPYKLIRPCPQAVWAPEFPEKWEDYSAEFIREQGNAWKKKEVPSSWIIEFETLRFKLMPTDFGHLGLFPEHQIHWKWMQKKMTKGNSFLNLFAYSGSATLALAKVGAKVCHLDASKGIINWARENAALNQMEEAPIRWIFDDALKFLKREIKREVRYQGILLDPPTFGRGSQGQVFKIERDILPLLQLCAALLTQKDGFLVLTAHTPGFTPLVLQHLLKQTLPSGKIETGEMVIPSEGLPLPCGSYARWSADA